MIKSINTYKALIFGVVILLQQSSYSQYSTNELIQKISSFQITQDDFYDAGLFPSHRTWSFSDDPVEDNTVFFTASIVTTLQMIKDKLDTTNNEEVHSIISNACLTFPKYQSRNGEVSYNFWQTVPPDLPFPNGNRLISNEKLRLPDDFDTSSLIGLSQDENDRFSTELREHMIAYSSRENRDESRLYTLGDYKNIPAYETWFGKDMPQAFDLSVISNVLLFVFENEFELNEYDSASIQLVKQMILNEDHLLRTTDISFHSDSPALLLYHVARVIAIDNQGLLDEIKEKVINDLFNLESVVESEIERVMIHSSLYRLGKKPQTSINYKKLEKDAGTFSFFSVNPFNISKGESLFLPSVTWVCEAYNWTLLLEMITLRNDLKQ